MVNWKVLFYSNFSSKAAGFFGFVCIYLPESFTQIVQYISVFELMGLEGYDVTLFMIYCDELLTSKDKRKPNSFCQNEKSKKSLDVIFQHSPPRDRFEMKIENSQNTVNMNVELSY